jgi:hypothetical protein
MAAAVAHEEGFVNNARRGIDKTTVLPSGRAAY